MSGVYSNGGASNTVLGLVNGYTEGAVKQGNQLFFADTGTAALWSDGGGADNRTGTIGFKWDAQGRVWILINGRYVYSANAGLSGVVDVSAENGTCLLYTSPSPRD